VGHALFLNSVRTDVPPPPGGVCIGDLKLLFPTDWDAFLASRTQFTRFWDKMMGMR
jgi:iron(III) transport system substrate-binding protein